MLECTRGCDAHTIPCVPKMREPRDALMTRIQLNFVLCEGPLLNLGKWWASGALFSVGQSSFSLVYINTNHM